MGVIGQVELGVMVVDPFSLFIHDGQRQEFLSDTVVEDEVDLLGRVLERSLLVGFRLDQDGMRHGLIGQ